MRCFLAWQNPGVARCCDEIAEYVLPSQNQAKMMNVKNATPLTTYGQHSAININEGGGRCEGAR